MPTANDDEVKRIAAEVVKKRAGLMTRLAEHEHPLISDITIEPQPLAARLKIRKGSTVRYTRGDEHWDYRVTKVSMPDEFGRCTVDVEPA